MFFCKPKPEPKVDRRGIFRSAVHEAIRNALNGYTSKDWPTYAGVAADLESFAREVKTEHGDQAFGVLIAMTDDRAHLERLLTALDASPLALQRDEIRGEGRIGDWGICGRLGHLYPDGAGFLLYVGSDESARRWNNVKARLAPFCHLINDGDDEGCFHLDRLPTPKEAELIREAIGIRKRRHLSDDAKALARANLDRSRSALKRPLTATC